MTRSHFFGNRGAIRPAAIAVVLGLILGIAGATFWVSFGYFRSEELVKANSRLSLYRSTVVAELDRFAHLPFVLAQDLHVITAAAGGDKAVLNARLKAFADRSGLDAIYLMDPTGLTTAASNADQPGSFVGQDYSFRPYFSEALSGQQGRFYGIGATTGLPGYFLADAVVGDLGRIIGVIAIKIDLSKLQNSWREAGERVFLANEDEVVLLSSNPDWLYHTLQPLSEAQRAAIARTRQFTDQPLRSLGWDGRRDSKLLLDGEWVAHLTVSDLPHGWSLHYIADTDRATTRRLLVTGSVVLMAGVIVILFQSVRAKRIGLALRRSEEEEAALRQANAQLAIEIEERRTAERQLKRTQGELERAGRLAALGQLAASVTHELGQPIAAMRNHLAAAELQAGPSVVTTRLQGLVDRMEGITRQLKFFARKGRDDFEQVDLRMAMQAALDLMAPNFEARHAVIHRDWPETPVLLHCNRLRIEQVMTNFLRNALDAVEEGDTPELTARVHLTPGEVGFAVADNGHGIGERTIAELSEPFVTTRDSGQGMGLGLAISAAIVEDHRGTLDAENRAEGGASFLVRVPLEVEE